jgi:hypothetical protein
MHEKNTNAKLTFSGAFNNAETQTHKNEAQIEEMVEY